MNEKNTNVPILIWFDSILYVGEIVSLIIIIFCLCWFVRGGGSRCINELFKSSIIGEGNDKIVSWKKSVLALVKKPYLGFFLPEISFNIFLFTRIYDGTRYWIGRQSRKNSCGHFKSEGFLFYWSMLGMETSLALPAQFSSPTLYPAAEGGDVYTIPLPLPLLALSVEWNR